jgi:hypothetical protein
VAELSPEAAAARAEFCAAVRARAREQAAISDVELDRRLGELDAVLREAFAAGPEPTAAELGQMLAENGRLVDQVIDGITDEDVARRLGAIEKARVEALLRDRDAKDSEPGDLAEVYARVEQALAERIGELTGPMERMLMVQVIDAAAPLLALRYRREGRLQADAAITWGTLDVTQAELLDQLYAERCAGALEATRDAVPVMDGALDLVADLVTVLQYIATGRQGKPSPGEVEDFRARLGDLRLARDRALPIDDDPDEEGADDDPADDR